MVKSNKKVIIITAIIVAVIVLLGASLAFAYIATDFLKTDKQLFCKYIGQLGNIFSELEDSDLEDYMAKQETMPYENNGKLSVNVNITGNEALYENANKTNITFSGKVDKLNDKTEQDIKLNYSDDVYFPFSYKHTGNLYALGSNLVANKYVAVRNENLEEFFAKLGINANIPDETEIKEIQNISDAEKKEIYNRYINILDANINKENFSKVDKDTFKLTLNNAEIKNVINAILTELNNDEVLLKDNKSIVQNMLDNVDSIAIDKLVITVYKQNGKLSKLDIEIQTNSEIFKLSIQSIEGQITMSLSVPDQSRAVSTTSIIKIEKIKNNNTLNYNISANQSELDSTMETYFTAQYAGLNTDSVQENYVLGINSINTDTTTQELSQVKYEYTFNTTKNFSSDVNIEDLTEDTALILNDQTTEYVQSILPALIAKIIQVNDQQMQQLGVNASEHPLLMSTPLGLIFNMGSDNVVDVEKNAETIAAAKNSQFEQYTSDSLEGSTVKILLQVISSNIAR